MLKAEELREFLAAVLKMLRPPSRLGLLVLAP